MRTVVYEPTGADLFKPLDQHRHPRHARAQEVSQRHLDIEVDRSRGCPQRLHLFRKVGNRGVLADALQSCLSHEVQQKAGEARPRDMAGQALQPQLRVQRFAHERSRQPPLPINGDRVACGDHSLLIGIAIEVAGLRVRRPVRILLATDVMVRHRHQNRRTRRVGTAVAENPSPRSDLLMMLHDRRRRPARQHRAAIAAERSPQQRILARRQRQRRVGLTFWSDVQHVAMLHVVPANGARNPKTTA